MVPSQVKERAQSADLCELQCTIETILVNRVRNLKLVWRDGGIILQGVARSYHNKQIAQHTLLMATDLPLAANNIIVRKDSTVRMDF